MKITIKYFGQLQQITRSESEECELADGCSVRDLLAGRAEKHGEDFARIVTDESGDPRPSLMLLRNGEAIDKTSPAAFADGDTISLLPAIAGG